MATEYDDNLNIHCFPFSLSKVDFMTSGNFLSKEQTNNMSTPCCCIYLESYHVSNPELKKFSGKDCDVIFNTRISLTHMESMCEVILTSQTELNGFFFN